MATSTFQCKSDGLKIPISSVNDGYCDCEDGSDESETHVCNKGSFICKNDINKLGEVLTISNMYVNDGICDCCDCSDENDMNQLSWTPTCMEKNTKTIEHLMNTYYKKLNSLSVSKPVLSPKQEFKRLSKLIVELKYEASLIGDHYAKTGKLSKLQEKRHFDIVNTINTVNYYLKCYKTKDVKTLKRTFGNKVRYLPLLSECISSDPISERKMKGGSTNYYDKFYSIQFCPFRSLTQISNKTETWTKRNDFIKMGGSVEKAIMIDDANDQSWEYTVLGKNNQWLDYVYFETPFELYRSRGRHLTQLYQGDDVCINGNPRLTAVLYECGPSNRITSFKENGMCNYEMVFETPYACSQNEVDDAKSKIDRVLDSSFPFNHTYIDSLKL